jgi:LL-diaminopimelate aminotransferase
MNNKIDIQPAERIASFKPYFFTQLNNKFQQLRASHIDIIRLDMGSPDLPPPGFILDAMQKSALDPQNHGYSSTGGTLAFREAVAFYYLHRFGVELDASDEIIGLIGSKEGIFNLSQVLLNPGDYALIPDPGYPVYSSGAIVAGAKIHLMPLLEENKFLPDFNQIPQGIAQKAKIMWLNYPNNPTGATAERAFFVKALAFAQKHNILIAHDAPYSDVCFDGYQSMSILQIPDAIDYCIEFNSLSKAYNMAGWRVGMAAGNSQVIKLLGLYKSQIDSSHFVPILDAAIAAMTSDQTWLTERNKIYQERRDIVISGLRSAGFSVGIPAAAIYVWAKLPTNAPDSEAYCDQLLSQTGVSTTPGTVYGENGRGYIRISLGTPTLRLREAMSRLNNWTLNLTKG